MVRMQNDAISRIDMHFAQAIERASIHAVRLHGWMWPLIITLAYTFAASPAYRRGFFSLSRP